MYDVHRVHCVSCGALIPRVGSSCPECQTPNLYRGLVPGEPAQVRLTGERSGSGGAASDRAAPSPEAGSTGEPSHKAVHTAKTIRRDRGAPPEPLDVPGKESTEEDSPRGKTIRVSQRRPAGQPIPRATMPIRQGYAADLFRVEPPGVPESYRLEKGVLILGYGPAGCDMILSEDTVSEQHAEFVCTEDDAANPVVHVRDLGSTNGTFVNETQVGSAPHRLREGDKIRIADILFVFRIRGTGANAGDGDV